MPCPSPPLTLEFTETLREAGVSEQQAEAEAEAVNDAFSEALDAQVATKADMLKVNNKIDTVAKDLDNKIDNVDTRLTAKINLVHWMLGLALGFLVTMFWKMFIS